MELRSLREISHLTVRSTLINPAGKEGNGQGSGAAPSGLCRRRSGAGMMSGRESRPRQ